MDEGEKKKKKEKAAVRGRQQKASTSANPVYSLWVGSSWDSSSRGAYRARESKGLWRCREPGCSQGGASAEAAL